MQHFNKTKLALIISTTLFMSGCASLFNPAQDIESKEMNLERSYLESEQSTAQQEATPTANEQEESAEFVRLNKLSDNQQGLKLEIDLSKQFSDKAEFKVSVNELPLNDLLHYTLGELLNVSYLIEPSVKSNTTPVTLELKEPVSGKKLFQLVQQILSQSNINVALNLSLIHI